MKFENANDFLAKNFPSINPESPKFSWMKNWLIAFPDETWEWQSKKAEMKEQGFSMSKIGGKWVALAKIGTESENMVSEEPEEIMRDDLHESPVFSSGAADALHRESADEHEARRDYEEDGYGNRGTSDDEQESYSKHQAEMHMRARYGDDLPDSFDKEVKADFNIGDIIQNHFPSHHKFHARGKIVKVDGSYFAIDNGRNIHKSDARAV